MLKLYHLDLGYRGSITVIAADKADALMLFHKCKEFSYEEPEHIEEFQIKAGLIIETYGDR